MCNVYVEQVSGNASLRTRVKLRMNVNESPHGDGDGSRMSTLRGKIWKAFLGVKELSKDEYVALVNKKQLRVVCGARCRL